MVEAVKAALPGLALLCAVLTLPSAVFAHRLDEYLQATLVSIEPGGVRLQINLTPGVAVAEEVLAHVDADHDGVISKQEAAAYTEALRRDLSLRLDGRRLELQVATSNFPQPIELRSGLGILQVELRTPAYSLAAGTHKLSFENRHLALISAYLINAAQPKSAKVKIIRQNRNAIQTEETIEFAID
jgi:hypothetical protein